VVISWGYLIFFFFLCVCVCVCFMKFALSVPYSAEKKVVSD
jgi:hypothetical protein